MPRTKKLCHQYEEDSAFPRETSIGSESMSSDDVTRVQTIAELKWSDANGVSRTLLTDDEVMNPAVRRGMLDDSEREVIDNPVVVTVKMPESWLSLLYSKH